MTCTLDSTPLTAAATGLTLYYDSATGRCYTLSSGGARVRSVLVNTNATSVVITFEPRAGSGVASANLTAWCGDGNDGTYAYTPIIGGPSGHFTLTFPTNAVEWGWDFEDPGAPPPIKIKVRVRRI